MTRITRFDEELVTKARQFLDAAEANPSSRAVLEQYGYTAAEQERGRDLVAKTARSFEWERAGRAWNFLSPTPARREQEARHWYKDARQRHLATCLRAAESAARSPLPVRERVVTALGHVGRALSIGAWLRHRAELAHNLERSKGERPADAPPPKDTTLVELSGWYERWRLLAQRVFRSRGDLMAPYGLTPGKAPPRLRGKLAQIRYGERAAGAQGGAAPEPDEPDEADSLVGGRVRGALRTLAGVAVGLTVAGVVGYLLGVKPADAAHYVTGVPAWAILLCVASSFVVLALQSARWHAVMAPLLGLRYLDAYRAQVVGLMFNAVLPARGGDLLRVQYLGRRTGKSRSTILGTEIVDRWLDWWGWIPTFLVLCVVTTPPSWLYKALGLFVSLLSVWAVAMVVLTRRGYTPRAGSRFGAIFAAMQTGINCFRSRRTWLIAFLLAPLPWLWETVVLVIAGRGFGVDITLVQAFSVMIGFNLATVVPSPGSVGTIEAGGTAALVFAGVDQSRALAFMFVYHFSQLLPGIMTGVALLIVEGEKLMGARSEPAAETVTVTSAAFSATPPGDR